LSQQHYYHLVATEVLFFDPDSENLGKLKVNVLIRTDGKNFTAGDLGRAQQVAQMNFFKQMDNNQLVVKDVFIFAVSNLGKMTEDQFQKRPADMAASGQPQKVANDPFN
jgi:hypothetical protein